MKYIFFNINDFGVIEMLTDIESKNLTAVIVFIFLEIISIIFNLYIAIRVKNKDVSIHSKKLKAEKNIKIGEEIYHKMNQLSYLDGKSQSEDHLKKIKSLLRYMDDNMLYIPKKMKSIITEYTDYHQSVVVDYRNKNYKKEQDIINSYINAFNK